MLLLAAVLVGGWVWYDEELDQAHEEAEAYQIKAEAALAQQADLKDQIEALEDQVASLSEPSPVDPPTESTRRCLSPEEIRETLISQSDPDRYATYYSAEDVEAQGFCCGAGYVIEAWENGEVFIIGPTKSLGAYRGYEPDPRSDSTFTDEQFLRYSRFEARRCRSDFEP
jgi:hypothetical protein